MLKNQKQTCLTLLELATLTIITFIICFEFKIAYNEMDVIPYAKSTFRNGLQADWYLNFQFPSTFIFNWPLGLLMSYFDPFKVILFGRIISYILISYSYIKLTKIIKLNLILSISSYLIFLYFFQNGIGDAGEWLVGGLESKVIAYALAILSLASFMQKKYKAGFMFSGLSLSVHLLVGIHNLFCLTPLLLLIYIKNRNQFAAIIKSSLYLLITGFIGISEIITSLTSNNTKGIQANGWDIYVNIRVPHHVIPDFSTDTWKILIILTIINILYLRNKDYNKRYLAIYALSSLFILVIGLITYYYFNNVYLRLYFFRFSDIMLPLISIILLLSIKSNIKYLVILLISINIIPKIIKTKPLSEMLEVTSFNINNLKKETDSNIQMTNWILKNTLEDDVFIIPPEDIYFCMNTERNIFISWWMLPEYKNYKSVVNIPEDMLEWYKRLKLLNLDANFNQLNEVRENYLKLDEKSILEIKETYPEINYILMSSKNKLTFPVAKKTEEQVLYQIQ